MSCARVLLSGRTVETLLLLGILLQACLSNVREEVVADTRWRINPALFGLEDISTSTDSTILRVWYGHSFSIFTPVVTITLSDGEWQGDLRSVFRGVEGDSLVVQKIKVQALQPVSGWNKVMAELDKLSVYREPDEEEAAVSSSGCCDGSSYAIEVKKGMNYMTYSFSNPQHHKDVEAAGRLMEILDLIEQEFQVPWSMQGWGWVRFVEEQLK